MPKRRQMKGTVSSAAVAVMALSVSYGAIGSVVMNCAGRVSRA